MTQEIDEKFIGYSIPRKQWEGIHRGAFTTDYPCSRTLRNISDVEAFISDTGVNEISTGLYYWMVVQLLQAAKDKQ